MSQSELDILILGPVPPPYGGVSAHISRIVPLLERHGLHVAVLNHFSSTDPSFVVGAMKRNPWNYYRLPKKFRARVVHYHHSRWSTLLAVALGKRRDRTRHVLTLHAARDVRALNSRIPLIRRLTEWALRRFDAIVVVNQDIEAAIQGVVKSEVVRVVPAFLPPESSTSSYERSVEAFLSSGRLLLVPAYRVQFLPDGRDLYGLDTAIEAFALLAPQRPDLRLAVFIAAKSSGRRARAYVAQLRQRLEEADLTDRSLLLFGLPLTPALRHDVIVMRPTRSEGDALSVREALEVGAPVVASDVVDRPPGVTTFPTDDVAALCATLNGVLDRRSLPGRVVEEEQADTFLESVMDVYREQLAAFGAA